MHAEKNAEKYLVTYNTKQKFIMTKKRIQLNIQS